MAKRALTHDCMSLVWPPPDSSAQRHTLTVSPMGYPVLLARSWGVSIAEDMGTSLPSHDTQSQTW